MKSAFITRLFETASATSLLVAFQYGSGILSSVILAAFSVDSPLPMACLMAVCIVLSAVFMHRKG